MSSNKKNNMTKTIQISTAALKKAEDEQESSMYLCPAHSSNLEKTIKNKSKFSFTDNNEYMWALNSNREKTWKKMNAGDVCVFGNKDGWKYSAVVKSKIRIDDKEDKWPFKSNSGPWVFVFLLHKPKLINISCKQIQDILGHKGVQSQTKMSKNRKDKILDLIQ